MAASSVRRSEIELQYQLSLPRCADGRRAQRLRDLTEGVRRVDVARWRAEVRPVEGIEQFRAELGVARTADREPLGQCEVEILIAGRPRDPDAAIAPGAGRCAGERVDVEPVVERLIRGNRIADAVRPLATAHGLERRAAAVEHGDGEAAARLENAGDDPSAEQRAGRSRSVAVATVRQRVAGGENDVVADVEERGPV